jgi:RNA-binding protein
MLGKLGLTEAVLAAADEALNAHELIKLKFQDHKEDRHALSAELSEKLNAETVAVLGNIAVLFRRKKEESAFKKVF